MHACIHSAYMADRTATQLDSVWSLRDAGEGKKFLLNPSTKMMKAPAHSAGDVKVVHAKDSSIFASDCRWRFVDANAKAETLTPAAGDSESVLPVEEEVLALPRGGLLESAVATWMRYRTANL